MIWTFRVSGRTELKSKDNYMGKLYPLVHQVDVASGFKELTLAMASISSWMNEAVLSAVNVYGIL